MTETIDLATLLQRLESLPQERRSLVAIAGPPGAGKSTVASAAVATLNARTPGRAAVLGMDGYHFDDRVLEARGRRARKGAPDTFDVGGLAHMLQRLRANAEDEVAVPVFDRDIEIARAGAGLIARSVEVVVVEGNYLLVMDPPWSALADAFDVRVLIRVSEPELRRRLVARWTGYGLTPAEQDAKIEVNDLPNGVYVLERSGNADWIVDGEAPLEV
jgi:pantothenate kinase